MNTHLSEEALNNLLLGAAGPADKAHLAACDHCAARVAQFHSSLHSFNHASAAWSEARSHTISRDLTPPRPVPGLSTVAGWSLAAAMVLSVGLALKTSADNITAPRTSVMTSQSSADEIATDNAMLHAIDSELSRPVTSPVETYAMARTPRRNPSREVRD